MTEGEGRDNDPGLDRESRQVSGRNKGNAGFLDFLILLSKHKKLVFGFPFAAGVIGAVISLLMPNIYTGTTRILPPQQSQSNASTILGQLGPLPGAAQALGVKNPNDVFIAMLRSQSVSDALIQRFGLRTLYRTDYLVDARKVLAANTTILSGKDGIITIEFNDEDPKRAAAVANAYVDELRRLTQKLAVGEAGQRRLFFEEQMQKTKEDLVRAEDALRDYREANGLVLPEGQAAMTASAAASIRAQITARKVQVAAIRSFATADNPEVVRMEKELAGLRDQLARLENDSHKGKGDVLVSMDKAPEIGLEYIRKYRDVKYQEALFDLLAKQYEVAKIDESRNATLIQVLDEALPPERKSKPVRRRIVLLATLVAAVFAVPWAFLREAWERNEGDPEWRARLEVLRAHWRVPGLRRILALFRRP